MNAISPDVRLGPTRLTGIGAPVDGILFLEDFDEGEPDGASADRHDEVPDPVLSPEARFAEGRDAGLAEGRAEGFAAGLAEGRARAAAADTAATAVAMAAVARAMETASAAAADIAQAAARACADQLLVLFTTCWPTLSERHGPAEAAAVAARVLAALDREPSVTIRAAAPAARLIEAAIARDRGGDGPVAHVRPDPAMSPGDVRVIWSAGEARCDTDAIWRSILAILETNPLPEPDDDR